MDDEKKYKVIIKFDKTLIPKLKSLAERLIHQSRTHLLQLCLISGAISAFLMPLYISQDFSSMQHVFIALSLICFLLSILIGMLYLSFKMFGEQRNILEMIDIIDKEDKGRADRFNEGHGRTLEWRKSIDIKTLLVDILFALGIISLITAILFNESGWYFLR